MALAHSLIRILVDLRRMNSIGAGEPISMLELGEQNWFGDVLADEISVLIDQVEMPAAQSKELKATLAQALAASPKTRPWDIAKAFYRLVFNYGKYTAIDLHGTEVSMALDLNESQQLGERFDLVTNIGTTEHVFNQYQAFKTIHDHVKPGGLMLHSLPNQGCFDHGFFNYHPTFFYDLCLANGYEGLLLVYVDCTTIPHRIVQLGGQADYVRLAVDKKLSGYSGLMCLLRAPQEVKPFATPRQGYYDNRLPPDLHKAWSELPR